jgi:hypothetical protein
MRDGDRLASMIERFQMQRFLRELEQIVYGSFSKSLAHSAP